MSRVLRSILGLAGIGLSLAAQPNIVLIFPDDQDLHLASVDYQPVLHRELVAKGTAFTNHYATVAQCCPSRASLLRGQAAHNTNITYVSSPGGNFDKWLVSAENEDYLPHWLVQAGYNTEYIGKFMNGYNIHNYMTPPKGWTHVDALVDPYTYAYNTVVMSSDGETPISYHNYHQTDVIRAKALDRLEYLSHQDKPFYLTIAPTAPHFSNIGIPVPLSRHDESCPGAANPRAPNFNPGAEYTAQKVSYLKNLTQLNETQLAAADVHYRARVQCLQGIDEIIEDVIKKLEEKGLLDNTYVIYTSDNGYHIGNHRVPAGKSLPYREDTNLPFYVRGPGVPANVTSSAPSVHLDLAPTFLEIAGLPQEEWPPFLDGRSIVSTWKDPLAPLNSSCATDDIREILNVEFWGIQSVESIPLTQYNDNSYKTLRIVGDETSYLYSRWCTNEAELYDTAADPYELTNLAISPSAETSRLMARLNALLLATKSCAEVTCRNPWRLLQPEHRAEIAPVSELEIQNLNQAMDAKYDEFFAGIPNVAFQECLDFQSVANEQPFWPENATLGGEYRQSTDNYVSTDNGDVKVTPNVPPAGDWSQRNATVEDIMKYARELTAEELE
ncbi:arylsulfatase [Xylariales sp. AK1849]|nr:arylsulfatase [Xylariales sp. AK1849]